MKDDDEAQVPWENNIRDGLFVGSLSKSSWDLDYPKVKEVVGGGGFSLMSRKANLSKAHEIGLLL